MIITLDLKVNKEIFNNPRSPIKQFFDQIYEDFNQSEIISRLSRKSEKLKLSFSDKKSDQKRPRSLNSKKDNTISRFQKIDLTEFMETDIQKNRSSLSINKRQSNLKKQSLISNSSMPPIHSLNNKLIKCCSFTPNIVSEYKIFDKEILKKQNTKVPKIKIKECIQKLEKTLSMEKIKRRSTLRNMDLNKFTHRFSKKHQMVNLKKQNQEESSGSKEDLSDKSLIKKYRKENKELKAKQLAYEYEQKLMYDKIKRINEYLNRLG
jgi:hypothetical protein